MRADKKARILREGFERGAQWAIMDTAYRTGGLGVVDSRGALADEDRDKAVREMMASLFVPKPKSP